MSDPRFTSDWTRFVREYWTDRHPLGLVRMSYVTSLVRDLDAATTFYVDVLGARPFTAAPAPTLEGTESRFVVDGEDTVLELAHPIDPQTSYGRELEQVGEGPVAVTFRVRDREQALVRPDVGKRELPQVEGLRSGEHGGQGVHLGHS